MKKLIKSVFVPLLMLSATSLIAATGTASNTTSMEAFKPIEEKTQEANYLMARRSEIQAADKTNLSFTQKRALRKEVRHINKQLREVNGIYLSVGAIIIIILLLVLIL